jgi:hypothetical protein
MVKAKVPCVIVGGMVSVRLACAPEALGVTEAGSNEHAAPVVILLQLRLTAWLNPPVAVMVICVVAEPPGNGTSDAGAALIVKSPSAPAIDA